MILNSSKSPANMWKIDSFKAENEVMKQNKRVYLWDLVLQILQILQSSRLQNLQPTKPCWTLPPCGDTDSWEATGWTRQDQAEFAVIITHSPYSYIYIYILYLYIINVYHINSYIIVIIPDIWCLLISRHSLYMIPDTCSRYVYSFLPRLVPVPQRRWEAFNCRVGEANEANAGREDVGSWRAGRWARGGAWDDNMDHIWIIYIYIYDNIWIVYDIF